MATLIREIETNDIPKLHELMEEVFGTADWKSIERLGGMTNRSYKVTRENGKEYLVRIPGEGTEELINRLDERKSTELACELDIDSQLLYFDDEGHKIMQFIHDPQPLDENDMRKEEIIVQAAKIFKKLHTCGIDTGVSFEVFEMANLYEKIIKSNGVELFPDYKLIKDRIINIKREIELNGDLPKVPCHNDSLVANWILDGSGRLYLIDWEYSGMNEAMWDLACLSIEADYNDQNDSDLLFAYYGRRAIEEEKKRFIASKLYVDYLWTLWGLTRVPYDGEFMNKYAYNRYLRLKNNLNSFDKLNEQGV